MASKENDNSITFSFELAENKNNDEGEIFTDTENKNEVSQLINIT